MSFETHKFPLLAALMRNCEDAVCCSVDAEPNPAPFGFPGATGTVPRLIFANRVDGGGGGVLLVAF